MSRRVRWLVLAMLGTSLFCELAWPADGFRMSQWPATMPVPAFNLTDTEGKPRQMADYRGKVVIVFFGFTHCPEVCPTTLATLTRAMKGLGVAAGHVQVLFVTLDPDRDTPALLRSYLSNFDPRFVGLTGSHAAVNEAAAHFSVQYSEVKQPQGYTIDHSTGIYVCDESGRLRLVGDPETRAADWMHDLRLLLAH